MQRSDTHDDVLMKNSVIPPLFGHIACQLNFEHRTKNIIIA